MSLDILCMCALGINGGLVAGPAVWAVGWRVEAGEYVVRVDGGVGGVAPAALLGIAVGQHGQGQGD